MKPGKKIYFASDFHLGVPTYEKSLEREHKIVKWLDSIKADAEELYVLGVDGAVSISSMIGYCQLLSFV